MTRPVPANHEIRCADCNRVLHGAERDTHSCEAQRKRNRRAGRKGKA